MDLTETGVRGESIPGGSSSRYPNGDHDGFKDLKDGHQKLIYNETDCKLNWQYMRLKLDTELREYVEFQMSGQNLGYAWHCS